jgi:hypothetical protein
LRQSLNAPDCRSARLWAQRPPSGAVTVLIVDPPKEERFSLGCCATPLQATRLLRLGARRHWLAPVGRTLTPLLATDAGQGPREEASSGPLV